MTYFGFVWMLLLFLACLLVFFSNQIEYLVTLVIVAGTLQSTNFWELDGLVVGAQVLTSLLFGGVMFLMVGARKLILGKFPLETQPWRTRLWVLMMLGYIICLSFLQGTFGTNALKIWQLASYIICFYYMYVAGKLIPAGYLLRLVRGVTIYILVVGFLQLLMSVHVLPKFMLISEFFWNDGKVPSIDDGNLSYIVKFWTPEVYFRLFATFMEPSYFASFAVGAFFFFLSQPKTWGNLAILGFLLLEIGLSMSSTAYGALMVTGLFYILLAQKGSSSLGLLLGGGAVGITMYFACYGVLDRVLFSKLAGGSANSRLNWNAEAYRTFLGSPVFGIGYKEKRANDIWHTLLAEQGICGLVIYVGFILSLVAPLFKPRNMYSRDYLSAVWAVLGCVVTLSIAVPDLDLGVFWMWLNILALARGRQQVLRQTYEEEKCDFNYCASL
ncbi:hypothetical protein [Ligilactobacillus equi]